MSGKNGIPTDKTVFLSLLAGETRLCSDKSPMLRRANAHQLPPGRGHCLTKARCPLCFRTTQAELRAVADNTLTIKQKSTLPVSKTRQDKSLFCSLSDTYLPPPNGPVWPVTARTVSRPENVCPTARFLSLSPHAVNSNIRPTENISRKHQTEPFSKRQKINCRRFGKDF